MPTAHSELFVERLTDCANRAVTNDGQSCLDIHSGHEAFGGSAGFVDALIGEAESFHFFIGDQRLADGRAGPNLD
jgi:tryptophanase